MEDMEVDDMELDGEMEVDQGRRKRAAQKLAHRLAPTQPAHQEETLDPKKAREMLTKLAEMACANKITHDNAFNLLGIDALRTLVFDTARAADLCGEGHFQSAGVGLEVSMKIYAKRVDATYNLAYSLGNCSKKDARSGDDADDDDQDGEGQGGGTQADGAAGEEGTQRAPKAKKRQGAASAEATLVDDSELKQRVKEPTFDTDPFFVRTSRLIDENSPQGLLLQNLLVLCGTDVVFDAAIKPQEVLEEARKRAIAAAAGPIDDVMVDLSMLPGALECLAAATSAPISPGIEQLYELLQPRPDLPGLAVALKVDPVKLLSDALAANDSARLEAHRNRTVRQAVRQVEDAMDVDMDDAGAGGGGEDGGGGGRGDVDAGPAGDDAFTEAGPGFDGDFDRDADGGGGGDVYGGDGYDSPGYGGGGDNNVDDEDDEPPGGTGLGSSQRDEGAGGQRPVTRTDAGEEAGYAGGADRGDSDDESALLSLLGARTSSAVPSTTTLQQKWWKPRASRAKKPTDAAAEGAKARVRKPKPEPEAVDFRSFANEQLLEAVPFHVYKTARRDASAKLCLPLKEPEQPAFLCTYFSAAAATGDLTAPAGGTGPGVLGVLSGVRAGGNGSDGASCSSQQQWRVMLMLDFQREKQRRRDGARAAALRKSLGAGGAAPAGTPGGRRFDGPSASGTDGGPYGGSPGGGEEYGTAAQGGHAGGDGGNFDDAGPLDDGDGGGYDGGYDDDADDDDGDVGGGSGDAGGGDGHGMSCGTQGGRFPTLEELLKPPRRVRRLAIKYDKSAGVADVATLKANIEVSLKELATDATASQRRRSAPQQPTLSFQRVLDQVSAHAAAGDAVAAPRTGAGARPTTSGAGGTAPSAVSIVGAPGTAPPSFLSGVSPHLAFICLLHLANEKGLALRNSEALDSLVITELGDLVAR